MDKPATFEALLHEPFADNWIFNYHYKQAANILLEKQLEQLSEKHTNMNCCPALYLYRHSIELILKDILWMSCRYADEDLPKRLLFSSHNLSEIWNRSKGYFIKFLKISHTSLNHFDTWIQLLENFDSNEFRYLFDNDGDNLHPHDELIFINLFNAKIHLNYLSKLLEDFKRQLIEPFKALDHFLLIDLWVNGRRKGVSFSAKTKKLF